MGGQLRPRRRPRVSGRRRARRTRREGRVSGMTLDRRLVVYACALVLLATGCKLGDSISRSVNNNSNSANNTSASPSPAPTNQSSIATGVEKMKPAPGTGNVQGKVLFNGKPVPNNEVKLCEKFNRFLGG